MKHGLDVTGLDYWKRKEERTSLNLVHALFFHIVPLNIYGIVSTNINRFFNRAVIEMASLLLYYKI